jgi:hypothetical protein
MVALVAARKREISRFNRFLRLTGNRHDLVAFFWDGEHVSEFAAMVAARA